ncbi:MAG TPA: hypothetical protein VGQ90_16345, partial [Stellaceae bacterium]|jgi:hypothetical protein|nr:hypothetical protein [Stellaceae bacterium]
MTLAPDLLHIGLSAGHKVHLGVGRRAVLEIVIDFDAVPVHQARNFVEALFHAFKDDKPASVSLAEVDHATNQLRALVHYPSKRRVRSSIKIIERLLEEYLLAAPAHVSENAQPS